MNIFTVSHRPWECAQALDDLRLNKMTLETGQLLSTAIRLTGIPHWFDEPEILYKKTHENHPISIWLREDPINFYWTFNLFTALGQEYIFRRLKPHGTIKKLLAPLHAYTLAEILPRTQTMDPRPSSFCDCSNSTIQESVFERYKDCLNKKWAADKFTPTWEKRGKPVWANYERN